MLIVLMQNQFLVIVNFEFIFLCSQFFSAVNFLVELILGSRVKFLVQSFVWFRVNFFVRIIFLVLSKCFGPEFIAQPRVNFWSRSYFGPQLLFWLRTKKINYNKINSVLKIKYELYMSSK